MASINEKLNYINETKSLIKDKLNNLGSEIQDETTFREYAEKIENLYEEWPKVSDEGVNISLNNTKKGKMILNLKGNINQFTTTGKNKFSKLNGTQNNNGLTTVVTDNNVFHINGTSTENNNWFTLDVTKTVLSPGTYTFSSQYESGTTTATSNFLIFLRPHGGSSNLLSIYAPNNTSTIKEGTFTIEETTAIDIYGYCLANVTFTNYIMKLQLEEGSTATEYEPYTEGIASPNPSYPQNINTVNNNNTISISNKNLLNVVGRVINFNITSIGTADGKISSTGTTGARYFNLTPNYVPINAPAGDYIFSLKSAYPYGVQFMLYNANNVRIANETLSTGTISRSFNITENATYYRLAVVSVPESTVINTTVYPMLRTASVTDDTYVAQKIQNYPLNLGVENLFDKDNANILQANLSSYTKIGNSPSNRVLYISVKPNTTYTIQKKISSYFVIGTTEIEPAINGEYSQRLENNNADSLTITTNSNAKYLMVWYYITTDTLTEQEILDSIQIEEGNTAHPYSPYGQTPIEMCNINNYADEIFKNVPECEYYDNTLDYGKWYKYGRINKVVLNGSETYVNKNITDNNLLFQTTINTSINNSNIKSNYFTENTNLWSTDVEGMRFYDKVLRMRIKSSLLADITTSENAINSFKNWLSTHNTEVYYILETPTKTSLSDTLQEQLENIYNSVKSYNNQTNIYQTNDNLPFIINVSALKKND